MGGKGAGCQGNHVNSAEEIGLRKIDKHRVEYYQTHKTNPFPSCLVQFSAYAKVYNPGFSLGLPPPPTMEPIL